MSEVKINYEKIDEAISKDSELKNKLISTSRSLIDRETSCYQADCSLCPLTKYGLGGTCYYGSAEIRDVALKQFLEKYDSPEVDDKKVEIKPFKMKVNPEQSKIVQEILFKSGYRWRTGSDNVKHTEIDYLYLDLFQGQYVLCYGRVEKDFIEDKHPELTFQEFMQLYSDKSEAPKQEIMEKKSLPKICIKGDGTTEYGKRIIEYLESLGGINVSSHLDGSADYGCYFINDKFYIWASEFIPKGYTEISLKEDVTIGKEECKKVHNSISSSLSSMSEILNKEFVDEGKYWNRTYNQVNTPIANDDFPLIEHKILRL